MPKSKKIISIKSPSLPWDLIVIGLIAGAMLVFRFSTIPSTDMRSRAASESPEPTGFRIHTLQQAQGVLLPPSVRTATSMDTYSRDGSVQVALVLNTGPLPLSEITATVKYDPDIFTITKEAVMLAENIQGTLGVELGAPGEVTVTVFITEEAGHTALEFSSERPLAYLSFLSMGKPITGTMISPLLQKSQLSGVRGNASIPRKIEFRSVEGVQLDLN